MATHMEFTLDDIQKKLEGSMQAHPELAVVAKRIKETSELKELLTFAGIDARHLSDIEFEILMVIGLYVPLSELSQNITESTQIPPTQSANLVNMVEAILLDDVIQNLREYDIIFRTEGSEEVLTGSNIEEKERLELHPDGENRPPVSVRAETPTENVPSVATHTDREMTAEEVVGKMKEAEAKPLTREELMKALAGKRTMAGDIEAVRKMRAEDEKNT